MPIKIPSYYKTSLGKEVKSNRAFPSFKRNLLQLYSNFRKVFKHSKYGKLRVLKISHKVKHLRVYIKAEVSASNPKHSYDLNLVIRRKDNTSQFTMRDTCEIRCNCPAFKYFLAHPDLRSKNLAGRPSAWNKVRNKEKNKRLIPGVCKHGMALIEYLVKYDYIEK